MPSLSLLCLTVIAGAQAAPRPPAGWVARALPPDGSPEWRCASLAGDEWVVAAEQEHLAIAKRSSASASVTLPFTPELAAGEAPNTFRGLKALEPVSDGYLAGFTRGEAGGGLFWFSREGDKHLKISPLSASWFPENVQGIFKEGRTFYVFQGLARGASQQGRVLKVQQESGRGWAATVLVDLGAAPAAVLEEVSGSWLVATTSGLTRVTSRGTVERIWDQKRIGQLSPSSIVRTTDSVVYVGMRAWVVRLTAVNSGPAPAELLAPASCAAFAATEACRCQPAKAAGP
jgi:hypothetical protein